MKHHDTLVGMKLVTFSDVHLKINSPYCRIDFNFDNTDAILDGEFTADQLEAIAAWMRNPGLVAGDEA